jgi:aspartate-semialdehyde dehydrogenase
MIVAIAGATGLVGGTMLRILEERGFPVTEIVPIASEKSVGKQVLFNGKSHKVYTMNEAIKKKPDIALFSAGGLVSEEWAPKFADCGTYVIDNSSAWRMHAHVPLIVPEINGGIIKKDDFIIANPNCSTIQLVMALWPIHIEKKLRRVILSTYQSVTGTGAKALQQLHDERSGVSHDGGPYPYPIDMNLIPQIDKFQENGYTKEEMKMVLESKKIMSLPELDIAATAVRVPVKGGHSESVYAEFEKAVSPEEARILMGKFPGLVLIDNPHENQYPMPLFCEGKDEVFIGRVRQDINRKNAIHMWVVADNLRKGAATNAVQIAELITRLK